MWISLLAYLFTYFFCYFSCESKYLLLLMHDAVAWLACVLLLFYEWLFNLRSYVPNRWCLWSYIGFTLIFFYIHSFSVASSSFISSLVIS
jgi:hypothetical protein